MHIIKVKKAYIRNIVLSTAYFCADEMKNNDWTESYHISDWKHFHYEYTRTQETVDCFPGSSPTE